MTWVKSSLGVGLGGGFVELVYLRRSWQGRQVVDFLAVPVPASVEGGTFSQEIQKFLLKNAVRPADALTLGLPREDLLFRHIETPPVQEKDLRDLVAFECQRHLPGRREEFVVGHHILGRTAEGGYRLLLGAIGRNALAEHLALLRKADLVPRSLQPATLCLTEACGSVFPAMPPALLLTVNGDSFTADYIASGRLVESRHFGGGGAAEKIIAALSRPLFLQSFPGGRIPRMLLHGPAALEGGVAEKLEAAFRVPVEVFSPLGKLGVPSRGGETQARFGVGLGAAILGLEGGRAALEMSEEMSLREDERPKYRTTAVLALVLLAVLGANFAVSTVKQGRNLALIEEEVARLREHKAVIERLSLDVQGLRDKVELLSETVHGRTRQADLLRELTALLPDEVHLSDYTFRGGRLEIGGLAPSASGLIPILETSPLFKEVAFSSAIVSQGRDLERFKIRLSLEGGKDG